MSGVLPMTASPMRLLFLLLLVSFLAHAQECEKGDCESDDDVWVNGKIWDMENFLDCENLHVNVPGQMPIHGESTWRMFHDIYQQVVGEEDSSIPASYGDDDGIPFKSGHQVPISVEFTPDAGRGVFAKELIPPGALVWKSTNTARFRSAAQYRQYLKLLPPVLACDVIHWGYARRSSSTGSWVICVDLDEGSFTNSGVEDIDNNHGFEWVVDDEGNEFYLDEGDECNLEFHANREVQAGEELRLDYSFGDFQGWEYLGLTPEYVPDCHWSKREVDD
jgi:hypothetical protein